MVRRPRLPVRGEIPLRRASGGDGEGLRRSEARKGGPPRHQGGKEFVCVLGCRRTGDADQPECWFEPGRVGLLISGWAEAEPLPSR